MACFTDEMIDQLKREVSLVRLMESQDHRPKNQGKFMLRKSGHELFTVSLRQAPVTSI